MSFSDYVDDADTQRHASQQMANRRENKHSSDEQDEELFETRPQLAAASGEVQEGGFMNAGMFVKYWHLILVIIIIYWLQRKSSSSSSSSSS